jgi:tetratricopeptide (TPR) repeat protein/transglutaminase-like putative cysteine protease
MNLRSISPFCSAALSILAAASGLCAQTLTRRGAADYSAQPYVVERILHSVQFENDGTYFTKAEVRVRIQSPSGIQTWGLIRLPYASSNGDAEIANVRVTKPNGTVVPTTPQDVQDMPAQITVAAPFYSDLKEKQLAVRGLDVGDVLEYEQTYHVGSPVIPGQFWYAYDFFRGGINLSDELRISVPGERYVEVRSPTVEPVTTEAGGYRIYAWKTANLKTSETEANQNTSDIPFADVQLTTFRSWDEIANWYGQLQESRLVVTPAIRAKTEELTRGATSEDEKIRALYNYVATKFRYVGIAFGIGRYQPHTADEVLDNGYGDCKDKHTLLAALLAAAGVKSYPALVNSRRNLDPDIPSPNQFDHMITVVQQGNGLAWLDTTPEVAPFGLLLANLRGKQVLVVSDEQPVQLVKSPVNPPFQSTFTFRMTGKIDEEGTLDAKAEVSTRGDVEVALRGAFRNSPQPQWKDVVQAVSQSWSFAGTVSDVDVSSPEATENPFSLTYAYTRKNYPRWPDAISPPLPPVNFAELPEDTTKISDPLILEAPGEYLLDAAVELPRNITPRLRPALDVMKDFAEYHATYSVDAGVLHARRRLVTYMRDIPKARIEEYRAFWQAVDDDGDTVLSLVSAASGGPAPSRGESSNDAAARQIELGDTLFIQDDLDGAIAQYRKALELEPESFRAHRWLGSALYNQQDYDGAVAEYRQALRLRPEDAEVHHDLGDALAWTEGFDAAIIEYREAVRLEPQDAVAHLKLGKAFYNKREYDLAIEAYGDALLVDPTNTRARGELGDALYAKGDFDGAIAEYREAARSNPSDVATARTAASKISNTFMQEGRHTEAIAELRAAVETYPEDAMLRFSLGRAHLHSGQAEDGMAAFQMGLRLSSSPRALNDVAYELADHDVFLEDALRFADLAVRQQADWAADLDLATLRAEDLRGMTALATYWDTLGWAYFRRGQLDEAERCLVAAWKLSQRFTVGDHLGQLYEMSGDTKRAAEHYALALAAPGADANSGRVRSRLAALLGNEASIEEAIGEAREGLGASRTVSLSRLTNGPAQAEFFLLFANGTGVTKVRFIDGSEELRNATDSIVSAEYDVAFPDDRPARIVRRGILQCPAEGANCRFVLLPVESVTSVN